MPQVSGTELLRKIHNLYPEIPAILMTTPKVTLSSNGGNVSEKHPDPS